MPALRKKRAADLEDIAFKALECDAGSVWREYGVRAQGDGAFSGDALKAKGAKEVDAKGAKSFDRIHGIDRIAT
jgi:hypothetical protein